jgi:hypothetical protein
MASLVHVHLILRSIVYILYTILACTEVNNGIWGSLYI